MPSLDNKDLWGERYARKADAFAATDWWKTEANKALLKLIRLPKDSTVLDFGCNTGRFIEMAQEVQPTFTYLGVDVNEYGLNMARRRIPNVDFDTSIEKVAEDETVDYVVCIHTLPQVLDLEDALGQVWRGMKRGAGITVVVHNKWQSHASILKNLFNGYKGDATIQRHFGAADLKQAMWDNGFLCESIEYFGKGAFPILKNRIVFHGRKPDDPALL